MASQPEDKQTKDIFGDEERTLMAEALKTHAEKVGRKAAADAPTEIKKLWQAELIKIEQLARKILTK
jgi:hypothetical protein